MASSSSLLEANFDWAYFVSISGEEGWRWTIELSLEPNASIEKRLQETLINLRQRCIVKGLELLAQAAALLRGQYSSSVTSALYHRYLAVLAYAQYCLEDFDSAERSLTDAHDEVRRVIERHSFLMPIASRCADFHLQRIRISRGKRCWEEMEDRIEAARRVLRDEEPLFTFSDGTPVHFATLASFYDSLPNLCSEKRAEIRTIYDSASRLGEFERFVQALYTLPGFAIGYP